MIPQGRHEDMEPSDCDMDDQPVMCGQCFQQAEDECTLCAECQKESDAINGIQPNGTEETATIRLAKFRTTDGRGTCMLDPSHDELRCPLLLANAEGIPVCGWTGSDILADSGGYLRPCGNCPIHKSS